MTEVQEGKRGGTIQPWDRMYTCEFCGDEFRGNGFFQHARACEKKPKGAIKKLYPIAIPQGLYERFHAQCRQSGLSLAQGVWALIARQMGDTKP